MPMPLLTIFDYSFALTIGVFALSGASLAAGIAYQVSPQIKTVLASLSYDTYLKCIGILSGFSTLAVLIYQYVYLTPVCELCWWQRICMFPIDAVVLIALYAKDRLAHFYTALLSGVGALFASYHYYHHFQEFVLRERTNLPCSAVGLTPSCAESSVLVFGFVTIPLMALLVFLNILILSYLAHRRMQS